ncbi:hypothetical protein [Streptomyces cinnamoneus]|uniref:Uncharacterized protein n=1 Tax=Streptomyces cinnamoneus TaxID=53446 RepID=A0A918TP77_STRCJ|nr:hypothetical protein [Streptomyces cinnamoneus]GHC54930.1 hypothetical protein GCM10010507_34030 [Streptomyces cinnamoneus]
MAKDENLLLDVLTPWPSNKETTVRPTIVLLSPLDGHRELTARLHRAGRSTAGPVLDRLERGEHVFGVDVSNDVLDEFEAEEITGISARLGEFGAVLLEYPDVPSVRDLLREVIHGMSGLLDTNHGQLLEFADVLDRFRRDPLWDWRTATR